MAELPPPGKASQPFTFCGVARFAHASRVRLACAAILFALFSSVAICSLAWRAWFPVLSQSAANLPPDATIASGRLLWTDSNPQVLGTNSFLSIAVQPGDAAPALDRDVNVVLQETGCTMRSLPGYRFIPYPPNLHISLARSSVAPVWNAWKPAFLLGLGVVAFLSLLFSWSALAVLYAVISFALGALLKRDLTYGEAWKLSLAAQWPGAVLLSFSLCLYAFGQVSYLFLLLVFALHFPVSWLYAFASPFCIPRSPSGKNPFNRKTTRNKNRKNPFANV